MRILVISCILVLIFGSLRGQHSKGPKVNWLTFEQLDDSLKRHPKPVLLFFHTDWCAYCKKMLSESFHAPRVVKKLNADYYAVSFDAESVDTIRFENVFFTNTASRKRAGQYHELAKILLGKKQGLTFPTTMVLDADFTVREKIFNYLSIRQLINIL
ncbi:MAG: thioredoxin family protein [Sphingobacterium sp.]